MKNSNILQITHRLGSGATLGVSRICNIYEFTCEISVCDSLELLIYNSEHNLIDCVNMLNFKLNDVIASCQIIGLDCDDFTYVYEKNHVQIRDVYTRNSTLNRKYNEPSSICMDEEKPYIDDFDWEDDTRLHLRYNDIVAYQLHVRGFTQHSTSKVKNKGKYLGVIEKIPHFVDLGINQIVLMPAYEYDEVDILENNAINITATVEDNVRSTLNYWGFKKGYYYSPKAAYAVKDSVNEFKQMVKSLHKAGIEVIMRFYFPDSYNRSLIADVLRFWMREYHVDGFFVMGNNIPADILISDLYLHDAKLYFDYIDNDVVKSVHNRNIASVNNGFAITMRKYLKSDENMIHDFLFRQRNCSDNVRVINYITNYEGFTLADLVSYDYKHNEANGEDNKDGEDFNYSWNCGFEGSTKKASIETLRNRQIKNALMFLMFAQGTPMLLAGDEFLNSQDGNNNPYCQDNEIGWTIWKNNKASKQLYDFTKQLISIRKAHPILHPAAQYRIMDYIACGFPDLSYHSEEAWAAKFDNHIRHVGVMLCGKYARINRTSEDDYFYMAYNMHWEEHEFMLPKLPKGMQWELYVTSFEAGKGRKCKAVLADTHDRVIVPDRSIVMLHSVILSSKES